MTYIPPERDDGEALDQTQKLVAAPVDQPLPAVGNGDLGGQAAPFQPEASPTVPFASDRGEAEAGPGGDAEPKAGRDRIAAQFVWEALLALLTAGTLFMVFFQRRDEAFGDAPISDVLDENTTLLAPVLLVAVALGLSLRFGVVNLAMAALMPLVASLPGLFVGSNPWIGLGVTAAAAFLVTVVYVLLVLVLRVPPWLAGLAVSAGAFAALPFLDGEIFGYEPPAEPAVWDSPGGAWLLAGVAVVAVAGGLLGLVPGLRDRMSAVKDAMDGPGARDAATVFTFIGVVFASSLLAACAGFLLTAFDRSDMSQEAFTHALTPFGITGLQLFAFIVVFLAGTSPRGRRGGVFGGPLAAVLFWAAYVLWTSYMSEAADPGSLERWSGVIVFGTLVLGLVAASALDRLGRPKAPVEDPLEDVKPFEPQPDLGLFDPEPATDPR